MLKRLYIAILLLAGTSLGPMLAQTEQFFPGDQYLGSSTVNDLMQDRWGRIWIATQGGLTRYDSHEFRTYNGSDGLVSNHVTRLAQDNNSIVVGTANGVQRFSLATLRFQHVRLFSGEQEKSDCNVNALLRRRNGDVLIATSGVGLFVLKPGAAEARYSDELMYDELLDVKDMQEAADGTLWMAANNYGVLRIVRGEMKVWLQGQTPMTNVCITKEGEVYACGMNGGIFKYDAGRNGFVLEEGTEHLTLNRLAAKHDGGLLIATEDKGRKESVIIEDRDGNRWTGISQKGLLLQYHQKSSFDYIGSQSATQNLIGDYCVSAVFRDHDGVLWVGTDGDGLYRIEDGETRHYTNVPANILCICEDRQGRLYVGSWLGGCGRLDKATGRYEQIAGTTRGDAVHVMSMAVDGDNNLWIATNGDGLKCLNLQSGELTRYDALSVAEPNGQENQLTNAWVSGLSLSPDGRRLYLAMSSGVGCLDLPSRSFTKVFGRNHLLPGHAVNAVREGGNGVVWVATADGLYKIENGTIEELKEGLPDNDVVSLELGGNNQLWIGTRHGLACFDTAKGTCRNYFKTDGLQGNEFYKGASCLLGDGRLAFGGTGGLTLFRPRNIQPTATDLRVWLTGLMVGGQEVTIQTQSGWYQVCDTIVSEAKRFDLAHNDNSLTLSFSTMDYARADGLHYEYRIGTDSIWQRLPMGVNVLTLSHLAPDTYPITVRAVTGSTVSEELKFAVVVHPAWYASIYAKIVYCMLALLMMVRYLRRRRRAEQQRLRVQEHIHAAQMREMEEGNVKEEVQVPAVETHAVEALVSTEDHAEKTQQIVEEMIEKPKLQTPDERLLERVMKVVNAHIADSDLSVEQIANEVGLSRSHLHRKMKELTGESTGDFVRNIRLKRAAYLLEGGRHSIAEVMYACGFDSPPGFSTRFKNFYGVSPSEYMKEHSYSKSESSE
ncbi:MAG: helix-turn-helix domain-containing protein [Prevotella sp.]|nr:helix-turn-helix domain-containing protein [Prevotella sp.]